MKPEDFYPASQTPNDAQRERMWGVIQASLPGTEQRHQPERSLFAILDRRSFIYGMAASIILCLALYGGYAAAQQLLYAGKPVEVRVDAAYQKAIREFEIVIPDMERIVVQQHTKQPDRIAPSFIGQTAVSPTTEQLVARKEQMGMLDGEIAQLRSELRSGDLSPVKQAKLRHLYKMKLQVLQEMIDAGEIDL